MEKGRLEAFSDGVIAVIITIMVLELHVPHGGQLSDLTPLFPKFFCYVLSFINVGLYWNNHHHMFQAVRHVNGRILWSNLHLLFWLSLIPVSTDWMGENHFEQIPVIFYGVILLMCGVAYAILVSALIDRHGRDSLLAKAIGHDTKGKISVVMYGAAIGLGFINAWIAVGLYLTVAAMWLIPDSRFEKALLEKK